ncbi:venom protein 302-like [Parasteatoda tepidariorum]|uniref:venom protein 302-like n=1 Tax=Parasteatoda tepidariorum TaxID=114398 RepID=UPI00077F9B09|nr:venom protein 302-like [Parasteatoda tepidariorum]
MKTYTYLLICSALISSCLTLDCPDCDKSLCKEVEPCRHGTTTDVCGCCPACYKGIGEECGGPWNVKGVCAGHLSCIRNPSKNEKLNPIEEFNRTGKCLALP